MRGADEVRGILLGAGIREAGTAKGRGRAGWRIGGAFGALAGAIFGVIAMLPGSATGAENIDQGKSAPRLFADSCATCHRSPRGLAKGRFSLTLYSFLQQHYSTSSTSAWALTSYLESVDGGQRAPAKGSAKHSPANHGARTSLRPPAAVPQH
jgi:mono/diheme cytochrome c family protein